MEGAYAYVEARAKKKVTVKDNLLKVGLIGGTVVFIALGLLTGQLIFTGVGMALLVLSYYFVPRIAVEYEYVYCDGQVDFDKINGGVKRKTLLKVDFDQVVVVAPKNSHALDGYKHSGVVVNDFSSMKPDAKVYAMVVKNGEKANVIYFEPNEKMLSIMKQKSARKIVEY